MTKEVKFHKNTPIINAIITFIQLPLYYLSATAYGSSKRKIQKSLKGVKKLEF